MKIFWLSILLFLSFASIVVFAAEEKLYDVPSLNSVETNHALEQFDEALILVDKLLTCPLNDYERGWVLWKKGSILNRLKQTSEALQVFDEIIASYVSLDTSGELLSSAFYEKSKTLSLMAKYQEAIDIVKIAIELTKQACFISFNKEFRVEQISIRLGRFLFLNGNVDEALQQLQNTIANLESLETKENSPSLQKNIFCELSVAYRDLIDIFIALNQYNAAILSCKIALSYAIKSHPENIEHPWILQIQQRLDKLLAHKSLVH